MENKMPKVSIIIPVFNVECYLQECLDSVVNQTLKDIEIICIDDGSTDSSLKILQKYKKQDNRIILLTQENKGAHLARTTALKIAKGEYIGFIDSDDWIDLDFFETLYNKAIEENADIVRTKIKIIEDNVEKDNMYNKIIERHINENSVLEKTEHWNVIWNSIYKLEFLRQNKIDYFDSDLPMCHDMPFTCRADLLAKKIMPVSDVYYYYRKNRQGQLIEPTVERIFCGLRSQLICTEFINSTKLDKKTYKKAYNQALNILDYFYNTGLTIKEFNKVKQKEYKKVYDKILNDHKYKNEIKFDKFINNFKSENILEFVSNKVFYCKNEIKYNGKRKVINIFGLKIKIQKHNSKNIKKICEQEVLENSILLIEANNSHGETLPGYIKYLKDLGYNIDVIVTPKVCFENPFIRLDKNLINNLFKLEIQDIICLLDSDKIEKYKHIIINSYHLYYSKKNDKPLSFFEIFKKAKKDYKKYIFVEHHLDYIDKKLLSENRIIQLADFNFQTPHPVFCNPNYFGEIEIHNKNSLINFITVGELASHRRNSNLLIDAVKELYTAGIDNFKITVIGYGKLDDIPKEIHKFFDIKGRLPYKQMYNQLEEADFFLPLLDPENKEHDRYIKTGTSGSFQLIYGFNKPCVIAQKFAKYHYFNNDNSVIYEKNSDFTNALKYCINITDKDYDLLYTNLSKTTEIIREKSLNNLKEMLEHLEIKTNQ